MILDVDSICGLIDNNLAELMHTIIMLLKLGVPLLLIVFGMLDFAKGVIASKEDEIKKGQHVFIRRLISAIIVFFVVTIVQLCIGLVDDKSDGDIWKCAELILNGNIKNNDKQSTSTKDIRETCCIEVGGKYTQNGCRYDGMTDEEKNTAHDNFTKCFNNSK